MFEKNAPDIVLLDIMLPELNGLEVLRRIRKTSHTPVIMLTARGDTFDKVSGLDSGAEYGHRHGGIDYRRLTEYPCRSYRAVADSFVYRGVLYDKAYHAECPCDDGCGTENQRL